MTRTQPFLLRARTSAEPEPDLTSMVVIHRAMRRDLARLAALAVAGPGYGRQDKQDRGYQEEPWT